MSEECDICGEEFDSERGLHEHQTKMHSEKDNTINLELTPMKLGGIALTFGLILGIAIGLGASQITSPNTESLENTGDTIGQNNDNAPSGNQGNTETIDMNQIEMEGEPVLGQEDAPVTMVVYEDFECPFCKRFEEGAVSQIKSNYIDSGQVKLVWKDRPLSQLHPWAESAAATMECVYREGGNEAFWNVKDKVFTNQDSVETSNVESKIKGWAAEEGVSETAVQSCLDNGNPMEEVNADSTEGQNLGASGTPTSFVNGQKLVGAQPYNRFETVIEDELSN